MRATWTSYNFRRTHYSEKLFERDSFGLIWNFAFTFHGLNNFRLLTRGGPRDPLLRYSWLFNYTPCFARSFFSPKLYRDSFFVDIEEIEPRRRINREGEGWEEVQVQGKENGKTWLRRRSFESLLFGMDVLSLLSSSTRIKHGGNTFEFEIGGDTYEEAR